MDALNKFIKEKKLVYIIPFVVLGGLIIAAEAWSDAGSNTAIINQYSNQAHRIAANKTIQWENETEEAQVCPSMVIITLEDMLLLNIDMEKIRMLIRVRTPKIVIGKFICSYTVKLAKAHICLSENYDILCVWYQCG